MELTAVIKELEALKRGQDEQNGKIEAILIQQASIIKAIEMLPEHEARIRKLETSEAAQLAQLSIARLPERVAALEKDCTTIKERVAVYTLAISVFISLVTSILLRYVR